MEKQVRDKNEFINFIKGITEKSTANIMFNSEKLKAFFQVREKKKTRCLLLPLLFNILPKFLLGHLVMRTKRHSDGKKEVKPPVFPDDIT